VAPRSPPVRAQGFLTALEQCPPGHFHAVADAVARVCAASCLPGIVDRLGQHGPRRRRRCAHEYPGSSSRTPDAGPQQVGAGMCPGVEELPIRELVLTVIEREGPQGRPGFRVNIAGAIGSFRSFNTVRQPNLECHVSGNEPLRSGPASCVGASSDRQDRTWSDLKQTVDDVAARPPEFRQGVLLTLADSMTERRRPEKTPRNTGISRRRRGGFHIRFRARGE
jgi:hypothetical protein